jgi:serine/threonine-protein phosphatase 6 regulatory ankyrin repeat subunit B
MLDEDPGLLSSEWDGETLLTHAARWGHVGIVRLLLERGADVSTPNDSGHSAMVLAVGFGREEVVSILLDSGANVFSRAEFRGTTALMHACSSGHMALVRLLLRAMGGRGLDARNDSGCTALLFASDRGHVDILRVLLLAGADHTIPDNAGTTSQQMARRLRHLQCVALIEVSTLFVCPL